MKKYRIWNSHKLSFYYEGAHKCNTREAIEEFEKKGSSLSSIIEAKDGNHIEAILDAIYNETDIELCFYEVL